MPAPKFPGVCYHHAVRRTLLAVVFVVVTGVAGALAYSAWSNEQDFERFMADGDQAVEVDRLFQAIEAYSGAVALKPDSMVAHLKRGSVYQAQGELDAALRDLQRATEIDPSALRPLELSADVSSAMGRSDRAIARYEAYVALDDQNARLQYKLALARYRAGMVSAAVAPLQHAIGLDPALGEAHYLLGLVQRDLNQYPAARASLETSVQLAPGSQTAAREALAEVYDLAGDQAKFIAQLEALAALEPGRPDRLMTVGRAQARAGRLDSALTTLSRAVERFPDAPDAYAALGHVWLVTGQTRGDRVALNKAVAALLEATSRPDATPEAFADLGLALLLTGEPQAAETALRQAVSRLPVPPDAFLQLATVTARDGRLQDARDALLKYAVLVGDGLPLAHVATQIADYSIRLGQPDLAVRWFDRALDEAGPSAALLVRLADAAWKAGDLPRARRVIEEGLSADPGHRALLDLKRRLPPS